MHAALIEALLEPVPGEFPAGPNLDYDVDALALDRALAGRPEVQWGDNVYAATVPDGPAVLAAAQALLTRSKDLRFACAWLRAAVLTAGWQGLQAGLELVEGLLQRYGSELHPQPEAEDGDLTMRHCALLGLVAPAFVAELRRRPLNGDGTMNLRDLEIACLPQQALSHERPLDLNDAWSQLQALAIPSLQSAWPGADAAAARVAVLGQESCGAHRDDLEPLLRLTGVLHAAASALRLRTPAPLLEVAGVGPRIESAQQALIEIDRIAAWVARTDARHPARLLLERARRLLAGRPFAAGPSTD